MKKIFFSIISICLSFAGWAQYAPPAGEEGSTAIASDSSIIMGWADSVAVTRGYMNASDPDAGWATYGSADNALGAADTEVVSLGDGGVATYTLLEPVANGAGPDFAVFENSFSDEFLELAFVEVSSDGIHYVRFSATSLTQTDTQIGGFGVVDATLVHHLAGKYRAYFGVPFDLEELADSSMVDINAITHIKIIDVVGSIEEGVGSFDSQGNYINDPFPTPFESSGFDLDAVALLSASSGVGIAEEWGSSSRVYPNPASEQCYIEATSDGEYMMFSTSGNLVKSGTFLKGTTTIFVNQLDRGVYILKLSSSGQCAAIKVVIR